MEISVNICKTLRLDVARETIFLRMFLGLIYSAFFFSSASLLCIQFYINISEAHA